MLGPTVEAIAREKAAIVSPGGTLVAALAHGSPTSGVAASVARARGAGALVLVPPSAAGAAATNLATARAVLDELGRRGVRGAAAGGGGVDGVRGAAAGGGSVQGGGLGGGPLGGHLLDNPAVLARARAMLPARLESARSACGVDVLLDGAHTPASAAALTQAVTGPRPPAAAASRRAPVLLLALMADKDARGVMAELGALRPAHAVCTGMGEGVPCSPADEVAERLRAATGCQATAIAELDAALGEALRAARERGTFVVVVGSLRLCGAVRLDPRITEERF